MFGLPIAALAVNEEKGRIVPAEATRYPDSATELQVVRLTSPENRAALPPASLRPIARHTQFLLYASDRGGSMQAWRMDLKSGESRQLTGAAALDPATLALSPDERSFFFFDGPSLRRSYFSGLHEAEVYRAAESSSRSDFALTEDGMYAAFVEKAGAGSKLQLLNILSRQVSVLATHSSGLSRPLFRPRRAQVMYRADGALWLVDFTGQNKRKLRTIDGGELGPARWTPHGRTIVYLHYPGEHQLNTIREITPDEQRSDKLIAKTSQFVQLGINGDASVFVGASRNAGSPYILLLLRVNQRELSLCEHHSSDPSAVNPMFSPDSQRIYFQSDRDGKQAIYAIRVEKFVEETDG